jgi:UDP-GlcNAc:undecaprenyl-phosphate GlcNAc-1-phosphate transferase
LALPIMDSTIALLRRRLTGRSIYMTDRGHVHHCLMNALGRHRSVLLVAAMACLASGGGAVLSVYMKNDVVALMSTGLVVALLVFMRLFGHVECALLVSKLSIPALSLRRKHWPKNGRSCALEVAVRLQGDRQWNLLWESLTEWAEKLRLQRVDLDVNLPAMKEGFHANWYQPLDREWHECWRMEVPLFANGVAVGRLQVAGDRHGDEGLVCDAMDQATELLGLFEKAFAELATSPVGRPENRCVEVLHEASANGHRQFREERVLGPAMAVSQGRV